MNERLKMLRKALGMTMEEFGAVLGISKSGVSEIESGRRNVTETHIRLLTVSPVSGKRISEEWIRTGEGEMFESRPRDELLSAALNEIVTSGPENFRRRLISLLVALPPEKWEALEGIAEEIAASVKEPPIIPDPEIEEEVERYRRERYREKGERERLSGASGSGNG